jgi:hypothetical protein
MLWHNAWISGRLATQEPDTGTIRCVYLLQTSVQRITKSTSKRGYRVRVTPVSSTFFMCFITNSTGLTGGLHDMKITFVTRQQKATGTCWNSTARCICMAVYCEASYCKLLRLFFLCDRQTKARLSPRPLHSRHFAGDLSFDVASLRFVW